MLKPQFKPQFKIDTHTHILPENWPDLAAKYGYGGFPNLEHHKPGCARLMIDGKFFREITANCWDGALRVKECQEHHVDVQVLSTVPVMFSYWAKPQDANDLSRFLNDHLASVVVAFPKQFIGLGTLPMQSPELAVKELERCVCKLGLAGIEIGTHVNDWNLDAPELFPIFEAAAELGAAVFVHPWDMMGKEKMPKYFLPWLVGMPAETSLAICSMIFGGVFERLPKLRVNFAHGGGAFPISIGRVEQAFLTRPDLCAVNNKINPRHYLGRFYVDSCVHDRQALHYLITLFGDKSVVLGSDYPFPLGEEKPGNLIESMQLEEPTQSRILHHNALSWLGVPKDRFIA
jgi:aminocarboxymuconate-semialdehyde decarboxylase